MLIPASTVYIGGGSALSFLQFVRDTVAAQIGPSQFSHNDKSDSMLETESAGPGSDGLDTAACDLNAEDSAQFAQIFQAAVRPKFRVSPRKIG